MLGLGVRSRARLGICSPGPSAVGPPFGPGPISMGVSPGPGPVTGGLSPGPRCRPPQAAARHDSLALGVSVVSRRPLAAEGGNNRGPPVPVPSAATGNPQATREGHDRLRRSRARPGGGGRDVREASIVPTLRRWYLPPHPPPPRRCR